jgi:glycosyltransferase involved in cell wall biosynthesis
VVPAFNEEGRLGPSLTSILAWAAGAGRPVELLVVDDGSTDGTARIAAAALAKWPDGRVLSNPGNRGKGYSIRHGVLASAGDLVLVTDADLSTPIEDAGRLLEAMQRQGGRGVVIGSRAVAGANVEVHQSVVRETMGKVFNRIVRTITGLPFADTQCGFKLMARADVAPIFERSRIDGFSYDVELLFVAVRRGLPVSEVPVTWRNAPGSKVGMLSDPLRMLRDVWRIRRWHAGGAYG